MRCPIDSGEAISTPSRFAPRWDAAAAPETRMPNGECRSQRFRVRFRDAGPAGSAFSCPIAEHAGGVRLERARSATPFEDGRMDAMTERPGATRRRCCSLAATALIFAVVLIAMTVKRPVLAAEGPNSGERATPDSPSGRLAPKPREDEPDPGRGDRPLPPRDESVPQSPYGGGCPYRGRKLELIV